MLQLLSDHLQQALEVLRPLWHVWSSVHVAIVVVNPRHGVSLGHDSSSPTNFFRALADGHLSMYRHSRLSIRLISARFSPVSTSISRPSTRKSV